MEKEALGVRGAARILASEGRQVYAGNKPGPMHRGAMNRVRSEEAALSRSPECRGKPGPLMAGLALAPARIAGNREAAMAYTPRRERWGAWDCLVKSCHYFK